MLFRGELYFFVDSIFDLTIDDQFPKVMNFLNSFLNFSIRCFDKINQELLNQTQ